MPATVDQFTTTRLRGRGDVMAEQQQEMDFGDPSGGMERRFWEFHERNPRVYDRLVAMTRLKLSRGRPQVGMGQLFEVLRWEWDLTHDFREEFKLNNNYRAFYARLIEKNHPDLRGVFAQVSQ